MSWHALAFKHTTWSGALTNSTHCTPAIGLTVSLWSTRKAVTLDGASKTATFCHALHLHHVTNLKNVLDFNEIASFEGFAFRNRHFANTRHTKRKTTLF